jgi:hypothetical protein
MMAKTGTRGHAVYFSAQATATARAVRASQPLYASATARMVTAMTGGSVMPRTSGKPMIGDVTAITAIRVLRARHCRQVRTSCFAMSANETASSVIVNSDV